MEKTVLFNQVLSVGCGIDVHKELIVATVRNNDKEFETREFQAFTSSLISLRNGCKTEKVSHIAMESSIQYFRRGL